ncbi:unnamed protein product [Adineta steineri]|uniref:Uncharacterized protein n=1 Tax=Adineta steineri TaxID=433720 RepID=A0A819L9A8_9BILA|nr:unnamed protein product [Adineta steineri]
MSNITSTTTTAIPEIRTTNTELVTEGMKTTTTTTIVMPEIRTTNAELVTEGMKTTTRRKDLIYSKWVQNGTTVAGGNGQGEKLNQLDYPSGIYIDDDHQAIYTADRQNGRIVEWKYGAKNGEIVAGGQYVGSGTDELNWPSSILIDKNNGFMIICDPRNKRVVRWFYRNRTYERTIIPYIDCFGIAMDDNGDLYVSDTVKHEVTRWKQGQTHGEVVAGGNGQGNNLNQLNNPSHIFIDQEHSVFVSDHKNHRVMKWTKGAKEGTVVAGGHGPGGALTHLFEPNGLFIDRSGNIYIADTFNDRVMCWPKGSTEGRVIVGGNGRGLGSNQFNYPWSLSLDRNGNLYVVDSANQRIQKFDVVDD